MTQMNIPMIPVWCALMNLMEMTCIFLAVVIAHVLPVGGEYHMSQKELSPYHIVLTFQLFVLFALLL